MISDEIIFDIEGAVAAAFSSGMSSIGIVNVTPRATDELSTPYGEVSVTVGEATGHNAFCGNGDRIHDQWMVNLTMAVVTNRRENSSQHGLVLAKLRGLISRYWQDALAMQHHVIESCKETSSSVSIDDDTDYDTTMISATLLVGIKSTSIL